MRLVADLTPYEINISCETTNFWKMLDKIETYFKVDLKDNNNEQLFYVYLRIFII